MDEGSKQTRTLEPLEVRARLGLVQPTAVDVADEEVAAHQGVDVDAAGEDVASGAGEVEAGVAGGEVFHHFRSDQGQLVTQAGCAPRGLNVPVPLGVAVTLQAAAGSCAGLLDQLHRRFDQRCDGEQLHHAGHLGAYWR